MVRKRFFNLVVLAAAVVRRRCRKRFGPRTATGLFAVADRTGRWRCGCSLAQHNASVATTMRATRGGDHGHGSRGADAAITGSPRAHHGPPYAQHHPIATHHDRPGTMGTETVVMPHQHHPIAMHHRLGLASRRARMAKGKALSETTAAPARGVLAHWPRLSGSLGRFSCHGHHGHHGHPWLKTWKKK